MEKKPHVFVNQKPKTKKKDMQRGKSQGYKLVGFFCLFKRQASLFWTPLKSSGLTNFRANFCPIRWNKGVFNMIKGFIKFRLEPDLLAAT